MGLYDSLEAVLMPYADKIKDLSYFASLTDLLKNVELLQGAIISMNKYSDYTVNDATTRLHAFVELDDVKSLSVIAKNDFEYEVSFWDENNTLIVHKSAWQSNTANITLERPAVEMRINIRKSDNSKITINQGINVYAGTTTKQITDILESFDIESITDSIESITDDIDSIEESITDDINKRFYPKLAIGIIDNSTGNSPMLYFDTSAGTVKVNKGWVIDENGKRYAVSTQTVAYSLGTGVSTQALVYDTSDGIVKPKYTEPAASNNRIDDTKHIILAFYHHTRIAHGTICTNLTYNIDNKYLGNMPKSSTGLVEGNSVRLKVCTYNLGVYNYGTSGTVISVEDEATIIEECRQFFSKQNCDILGLQENRQTLNTKATNAEIYDYLYPYSYGYYNWTWLKSRYPLSNTGQSAFVSSERQYVYGTLNIEGLDVFVICVHFALTSAVRAQEYAELIEILNEHEYFICFGDFNANSDGTTNPQDEFAYLTDEGYHIANGGYLGLMTTHPQDNKKLDNIVTSDNIVIADSYVPSVYDDMHSDHLPIIAELVICS